MILKSIRIVLVFVSAIVLLALTRSGPNAKKLVSNIDSFLQKPEVKAFLDTISYAEGTFAQELNSNKNTKKTNTKSGYNILYAGHTFKNFDDHPRCLISSIAYKPIIGKRSTAAGRYQILERTWDSISSDLALKNFSPLNQDRAALGIIRQVGALKDISAGRFDTAIKKLSSIWASLPYATYGQPTKSLDELKKFYTDRLKFYKKLN